MEAVTPRESEKAPDEFFATKIVKRRWLSSKAFELVLSKPPSFTFLPGQRVRLSYAESERDYSIVSAPGISALQVCIRHVPGGKLSPKLAQAPEGSVLTCTGPHGYFTYKTSRRPAVFVATGTGIAPFCSMAASGVSGFIMLHGAETPEDLYYQYVIASRARQYVPCLSGRPRDRTGVFSGRVTDYMAMHVTPGAYDFYLCGRQEMIRDATLIADERFPGSLIYSETFY